MNRLGAAAVFAVVLTSAASAQSGQPGAVPLRSTTAPGSNAPVPTVDTANTSPISILPKPYRPARRPRGAPIVAGNNNIFVDEAGQLSTTFRP